MVRRQIALPVVTRVLLAHLEQRLVELRLTLLGPYAHHARDLVLGHEGPLEALEPGRADRPEQHVALSEQGLGAALVEDHARIDLRGDRERDASRDVHLDRPGDHVGRRPLGRQHQMDPDCPRLLREANDRVLDLRRGDHHQVRQLVDHAEDVRQWSFARPSVEPGSTRPGCASLPRP